MHPATALPPPTSLAQFSEAMEVHNEASRLSNLAAQLARAVHPAAGPVRSEAKALARKLSRDLQALRGRL